MQKRIHHAGCRLTYDLEGAGPPVVFIQGIGAHGSAWQLQVDDLKRDYQCLSFDNRGIGLSQPRSVNRLTIDQTVSDVLALMDAEGWDRAHIVGHSLGGLVAQEVALAARSRVLSLALLNTFASGRSVAPLTAQMFWWGLRSVVGTRAMRRYAFLRLVWPADAIEQTRADELSHRLGKLIGHDLGIQPPMVPYQYRLMRRSSTLDRLSQLAGIPTLVLSSAHDMLATPALGKQIAAGIPGAKYRELADASHASNLQFPEVINEYLRDHWRVT